MRAASLGIAAVAVAAAVAGGLYALRAKAAGPITSVMQFCETVPPQDAADARMAGLGWVPLSGDADADLWVKYVGINYLSGRRAVMDDWQAAPELENMRLYIEDFRDRRLDADFIHLYKRAEGKGLAMIEWVDGMPSTVACDVFLPEAPDTADFQSVIFAHPSDRQDRGFASYSFTEGQLPRPGLWLASVTTINPDIAATHLGETPELTVFATGAWRGELPQ